MYQVTERQPQMQLLRQLHGTRGLLEKPESNKM